MFIKSISCLILAAFSMLSHVMNQKASDFSGIRNEESNLNILINRYDYNSNSWSAGSRPIYPDDAFDGQEYDTVQLFENLEFIGKEFIGEDFYESLSSTGQHTADYVGWCSHNINLYSGVNANSYQIGIPITSYFFELLSNISIDSSSSFYVPAIKIDNDLVAYFYVSGTTTRLIVKECEYIFDVHQTFLSYDDGLYGYLGYSVWSTDLYYFIFDIDASKKNTVNSISKIDNYRVSHRQHPFYTYEYSLGYLEVGDLSNYPFMYSLKNGNDCVVSPYDLTYLNLSGGYADFSLGNSIYGELYGTSRQHMRLISIDFEVNYKGISSELDGPGLLQFRTMSHSEYNDFVLDNSRAYDNSMVYLSRGKYSDEVGGEGSLINAYYSPKVNLRHIDDSIISVSSMTFVKADQSDYLHAPYDPREDLTNHGVQYSTVTIDFPCNISSYENARGISYKYHYDPAVGKCSQRTVGINLSSEFVTTYVSSPITYSLANLVVPVLGGIVTYICDYVTSGNMSSGKNIQRIMFNLYDSRNQLIRNITQLQFAYQKGNREPQVIETEDGIYNLTKFNDLNLEFITRGKSDSLVSQSSNIWRTISTQENGFMELPQGQSISVGEVDYTSFYQNIYNTKTRADFMCYWSALSVWHVIDSGETERLTTNVDGYYLVYDEDDMNWHVVSIDNPDEDAGISVDDYLNSDTYGHSDGIESPEDNDFDKKTEDLSSGLEDFGKWFGILNAIILGIGLIGGIIYLVIRFGGFFGGSRTSTTINLSDVDKSGGSKRKKRNKARKEKRKRKKKK